MSSSELSTSSLHFLDGRSKEPPLRRYFHDVDILDNEILVFPCLDDVSNERPKHWLLAIVNLKLKRIMIFNSNKNKSRFNDTLKRMHAFLGSMGIDGPVNPAIDAWIKVTEPEGVHKKLYKFQNLQEKKPTIPSLMKCFASVLGPDIIFYASKNSQVLSQWKGYTDTDRKVAAVFEVAREKLSPTIIFFDIYTHWYQSGRRKILTTPAL